MNSSRKYILMFYLACSVNLLSQEKEIKGYVGTTDSPIIYATVLDLNNQENGTTTDSTGYFCLKVESNTSLYVSAIGYHDTIVNINKEQSKNNILLRPRQYSLKEITVKGKKLNQYQIGSKNYSIQKSEGKYIGFPFKSAGLSHGVYVKINRKTKNSFLKSIDYFVSDCGPLGGEFLIRFLVPQEKMIPNRHIDINKFLDLCDSTIILKAAKRGWNTLNCSDYNITIPNNDIVVLLTPIYMGESLKWHDNDTDWYGSEIAFYDKKKLRELKWVHMYYDKLCFIDVIGVDNNVPAFVLNILK